MSRTTQALLKLQQELAASKANAGGESAPIENATIPAGKRPDADAASEEKPRKTKRVPRKETEELASIEPVEPPKNLSMTAVISDIVVAEPSDMAADDPPPPVESDQQTMRFGLSRADEIESAPKSDPPAAESAEPPSGEEDQDAKDAISTVNYGAGFRLPALSDELARQLADLKQSGHIVDPNEPSQPASESAVEASQANDDEIFSVEIGSTQVGPFSDLAPESISTDEPQPTSNEQSASIDQDDQTQDKETRDEVAVLQQAFHDAPFDAVTGSTDWPASEEIENVDSAMGEAPTDEAEREDTPSHESPNIDSTSESALSDDALDDESISNDAKREPNEDKNGVRLYGPPAGNTIYSPLEEVRGFELAEPSAADQLKSERSLRSALQAEHSPEDDNVFWQAKAKKRRAKSASTPPAPERVVRNPEDFGESVVMHRRPAATTSFDQWLDKRLEDSTMRNALSETADEIRQLFTYASSRSLLLASGNNSKQVYQPAALTAIRLAEQTEGDVLLIDASLETQSLSDKLVKASAPGLSEALLSPRKWAASCHCWRRENLFFMPTGSAPVTSFASSGKAFVRLLDFLQPRYDFVVVDGGEINDPFLQHIAKVCYGALLVVRLASTQMDEAAASMQKFRTIGARVVGCLATNAAR